jgi:hypothetical protein
MTDGICCGDIVLNSKHKLVGTRVRRRNARMVPVLAQERAAHALSIRALLGNFSGDSLHGSEGGETRLWSDLPFPGGRCMDRDSHRAFQRHPAAVKLESRLPVPGRWSSFAILWRALVNHGPV